MIYDYLILGAGPAGLTFANMLIGRKNGCKFVVLEKENAAGGLCRSQEVDGAPFDIGGGHFLDTRRPKVNEFLFHFMPEEEWNTYNRDTSLVIGDNIIGQPIEAYIWQLPIDDQIEYLKAISSAGCNTGAAMPEKFTDWIYWKLGERIAEDYMIPYNKKMFGKELNSLGTYWLEKLPSVSFEETLRSCLEHRKYGTDPGHTHFYYPKKYGYGELWLRMASELGSNIHYGCNVACLDVDECKVELVDGSVYKAKKIITTIPWTCFRSIKGITNEISEGISRLKYSSVITEYHEEHLETTSHWIYYPDPKLSYHRILVRHNFCEESKGYWTETNSDRSKIRFIKPLQQKENGCKSTFKFMNEYAYPLNTIDKPKIVRELLDYTRKKNVIGLGRWGEWEHFNSDVTVDRAMSLAQTI